MPRAKKASTGKRGDRAMKRFGPSRGELKFRLGVSVAVGALLVAAVVMRGANGLVALELVVFGGAFIAGSIGWCLWKLLGKHE